MKRPDPNVSIPAELERFYASHSPVLLSVGGFEPEYEPLEQIAAIKRIREDHPDAGLMILGGGSLKAEAEAAVRKLDHSESVMLAGNVEHGIALHLMERADIMLRITKFDGDAISVREALFLGTPVIATNTGTRPVGVNLINSSREEDLVEAVSSVPGKNGIQRGDDGSRNIREVLDLYDALTTAMHERRVEAVAD